ncbi:hypothetical protein AVEN_50421-1 [Araneus ventricosus]|uniref:Uncharacterized protein n=1 Tax=Araneus ventricosus TaxID=182803 RepID=A0A4Y2EUQ0_ARAVE|nr:hypothetical protein AVEN_50421-1 [Araneus ventricosus]
MFVDVSYGKKIVQNVFASAIEGYGSSCSSSISEDEPTIELFFSFTNATISSSLTSPDKAMNASKAAAWNTKLGHPSDLDWGFEDSRTHQKIESKESSWNCGNPKKRRQLVERFAQTSSVHGTHFICSRKNTSCLLKFIYRQVK